MELWKSASFGTLDSQRSATKGISLLLGLASGQEKSPKGQDSLSWRRNDDMCIQSSLGILRAGIEFVWNSLFLSMCLAETGWEASLPPEEGTAGFLVQLGAFWCSATDLGWFQMDPLGGVG